MNISHRIIEEQLPLPGHSITYDINMASMAKIQGQSINSWLILFYIGYIHIHYRVFVSQKTCFDGCSRFYGQMCLGNAKLKKIKHFLIKFF